MVNFLALNCCGNFFSYLQSFCFFFMKQENDDKIIFWNKIIIGTVKKVNVPSKKTLFTRHGARNGMPIPSSRWLQTALTTKCDEWIACAMNRYLRTCDLYLIDWNATYEFSVRESTQEKSCKLSFGAKTQLYVDIIFMARAHIFTNSNDLSTLFSSGHFGFEWFFFNSLNFFKKKYWCAKIDWFRKLFNSKSNTFYSPLIRQNRNWIFFSFGFWWTMNMPFSAIFCTATTKYSFENSHKNATNHIPMLITITKLMLRLKAKTPNNKSGR